MHKEATHVQVVCANSHAWEIVCASADKSSNTDAFTLWHAVTQIVGDVQLDRTLVRRMAAMSGNILVDPGSDDEEDLYNIYVSPSMVNAEGRAEQLNPYVSLSKNLRRTHTPPTFDDYDDAADAPGTNFDMHSVAQRLHHAQDMEATGSSASPSFSPRS